MRESRPLLDDTASLGIRWEAGWKRADSQIEADAKALWRRMAVLPEGVDPDLRAEEIIVAAYSDGALAAVSTAFTRELRFLKSRFAMLRVVVAPEFRKHSVARVIGGRSKEILEQWAYDHPEEKVMGMAAVIQSADIMAKARHPIWRRTGLVLVGYTAQDEPIRVAWFDHVEV